MSVNHSGEIRPKAVGGGIFGRFSNFDKCRLEVAGDVIPGEVVEYVSTDVVAKVGDSKLNTGRIIRPFVGPFLRSLCSI